MPREDDAEAFGKQPAAPRPGDRGRASVIEVPPLLKDALRPWIDVEEVGSDGFCVWLRSVLPLIPPPRPGVQGPPSSDPVGRVRELAAALAECSGDRARAHFQAVQYYRENQALARRVKALEVVLEAARRDGPDERWAEPDPEAEEASRRYLPSDRRSGRGSEPPDRR